MPHTTQLTPEGHERLQRLLQQEYARLEEARRVVQEQLSANDNENLGLSAAQQDLLALQERIAGLEDSLAQATVLAPAPGAPDTAQLGSLVTLQDMASGRERRLQLVAPLEASAVAGERPRVSTESPVGQALLGRRVGETFTVNLGSRSATYRVLSLDS
ncbi:GreA/GreB family elongation factor [Deinococcus multiflagellatus]|uniref:GreA/GreB family elongation factor n=1 Tax=Deinococcus multiflagellatus TaxID=1656887 RepID=A0ABW1ZM35_9DEIO|nr:GreA/GreB family elongation factor [Deinococcus multiflagellatus]MBZ9713380.1 GreA/GreB family elongation factor [Deinococcus multiflagellatus]